MTTPRAESSTADPAPAPPQRRRGWGGVLATLVAGALLATGGWWIRGLVADRSPEGSSPAAPSVPPAPTNGRHVNVQDHGVLGDGITDNTAQLQLALDTAPDGSVIFFPEGTYLTGTIYLDGRRGLSFVGEGDGSVIRRHVTPEIAVLRRCRNITIRNLAFDANGIDRFGGIDFRAAKRVLIKNSHFYDSNRQPVTDFDRYAVFFGPSPGKVLNEDIRIFHNRFEDLQVEVDHARRVEILRNTSVGAVRTAAFGAFSQTDRAVAEDYRIDRNVVIDPEQYAFALINDPPDKNDAAFRRISIRNNRIERSTPGNSFRLGTGNTALPTVGNVFEDIVIRGNRLVIDPEAEDGAQPSAIFAAASSSSDFHFERLVIRSNLFVLNGKLLPGKFALDLNRLANSVVTGNRIFGVGDRAITFQEDLGGNIVKGNRVRP